MNDDIYQAHNRKDNDRETGISDQEVPRRNEDDMRQHPSAVRMHDFQSDICFFIDDSSPRGLHQDLADQFLLGQMVSQDGCSECSYRYEMYVKQTKGNFAH